jgi:anti-sigma factor RsiW
VTERGLTCREVIDTLTDYLEDALPPEDRRRVEQHLAICDGCTTYLEQMRETIRLTGKVTEEQIPEEEKQRLLAAFRDWTRPGAGL